MKYIIIALLLIINLCACEQHSSHATHHELTKESDATQIKPGPPTNFPTVGFEQSHEVLIPFSPTDVWPLFEPGGRHLIYNWWDPTVLREGKDGSLKGLLTVSEVHSHEVFLTVTEHDPKKMHIQYLVLWDDFELQRIDIRCSQGETKNSARVVWTERNAGIHENGVSMVSDFVEGGHLVKVVERYAEGVEEYLQNQEKN